MKQYYRLVSDTSINTTAARWILCSGEGETAKRSRGWPGPRTVCRQLKVNPLFYFLYFMATDRQYLLVLQGHFIAATGVIV